MARVKNPYRRSEDDEQSAVIQWAKLHETRWPVLGDLFHAPNGGSRPGREGAKFRRLGVRRGVPDLQMPAPNYKTGAHGLFIEMKAEGGRLSPEQKAMLERLKRRGYCAEVCYGADEAISVLKAYLDGVADEETGR